MTKKNDDNHIKERLGAADDEGDDQEEEGDQVTARFDNHEMAGHGVDDEDIYDYDYDEEEEKEEGVNNNDEEDEDDDEDEDEDEDEDDDDDEDYEDVDDDDDDEKNTLVHIGRSTVDTLCKNDDDEDEDDEDDDDDDDDDDEDEDEDKEEAEDNDNDKDYDEDHNEDDDEKDTRLLHIGRSTLDASPTLGTLVTISNSSSSDSESWASESAENKNKYSDVQLPIVPSLSRPSIVTQTLPNYNYNSSDAPCRVRDSIVTYETMDARGELSLNSTEPFASPGIISLQSYVKRGRGIVWQNRSSCKLHYETDLKYFKSHTKRKARLLQIQHNVFYPDEGQVHHVISGKDNARYRIRWNL